MKIPLIKSPNYDKKTRPKKNVLFVIFHYTGMQSEIESINRLCNNKSKVSCHYFINRKGRVLQLVKENKVAWHAGKSKWKNFKNLNEKSIGIELCNKGHEFGYQNFSKPQIVCLLKLCKKLKKKYKIKNENFLGHSDVSPLRKQDPGEKFPWKKLSKFNIGIWYKKKMPKTVVEKKYIRSIFFKNLFKIGYRYFNINKRNKKDRFIITAFQRRYYPEKITGLVDEKTMQISQFLANSDKFS